MPPQSELKFVLEGERVLGIEFFQDPTSLPPKSSDDEEEQKENLETVATMARIKGSLYLARDLKEYIGAMSNVIALAESPLPDSLRGFLRNSKFLRFGKCSGC
jgi:hypothetical protein